MRTENGQEALAAEPHVALNSEKVVGVAGVGPGGGSFDHPSPVLGDPVAALVSGKVVDLRGRAFRVSVCVCVVCVCCNDWFVEILFVVRPISPPPC